MRIKLSGFLIGIGIILAFLPYNPSQTFRLKPTDLIEKSLSEDIYFTVDQIARFVNSEDSTVQLIDVRSSKEFNDSNIPGSINIPLVDLLNPDWEGWINQNKQKIIYYGNGDRAANMAWTIVTGLGYKNSFIMKGGLNEWYKTVMLTRFEGQTISARENALFENRYKARRLFNEINSLPDSLKTKFLEAKRLKRERLDGGC